MSSKLLRLPQVMDRVGLHRSSIYAAMQTGAFPRPVSLGSRAVGWLEHDIEDWIASRITTHEPPDTRMTDWR